MHHVSSLSAVGTDGGSPFILALLLASGLVNVTKNTNGASSVSCSENTWKDFLERYGLGDGSKGHCEITTGKVYYKFLEDDRTLRQPTDAAKMRLLRIGKYKVKGETVKATLQINSHQPPPSFNHKHRSAQRILFNDIREDFSKYLFHDRMYR